MNKTGGTATASITRSGPNLVLLTSSLHVIRDAGVQRVISTPKQVNEPLAI